MAQNSCITCYAFHICNSRYKLCNLRYYIPPYITTLCNLGNNRTKESTIHPREEQGGNKRKKRKRSRNYFFFRATIGKGTKKNDTTLDIYLFHVTINFTLAPPPQILTSFPKRGSRNDGFACAILCNGLQLTSSLLTRKVPRVRVSATYAMREKPQRIGIRAET